MCFGIHKINFFKWIKFARDWKAELAENWSNFFENWKGRRMEPFNGVCWYSNHNHHHWKNAHYRTLNQFPPSQHYLLWAAHLCFFNWLEVYFHQMSQPANLSEELDQLTIFFIIESVANYSNKKNMKLPAEGRRSWCSTWYKKPII